MPDELIFPKAAFIEKLISYDISLEGSIKKGEKIKIDYSRKQQEAALCSGLGPNYRLPKQTCLALNENHDIFCRENANRHDAKYGLNRNDQYLGICDCD